MISRPLGRTNLVRWLPLHRPSGGKARDVLYEMTSMLRAPAQPSPNRSRSTRAFTLVELMIVVAIVGVLAALGLVGFRKYLNASHSSEAINIIGSIKSAQESYRAETLSYLNVSTNLESFYPRTNPDDRKMGWGAAAGNDYLRWQQLNVDVGGPTLYAFATIAGLPGQAVPTGNIKTSTVPAFPAPVEPWYVIQAIGDVDNDDVNMYALASSFSTSVYVDNDDE